MFSARNDHQGRFRATIETRLRVADSIFNDFQAARVRSTTALGNVMSYVR